MIRWMLQEMVRFPAAVFSERELHERFADELAMWGESRLVRRVERSTGYWATDGSRRTVYADRGQRFAVADDDPDVVFEPVRRLDEVRWRLDLLTVAERIKSSMRLQGEVEQWDSRVIHCGNRDRQGFVLALVDRSNALDVLLKIRRPVKYDKLVAVCAGFNPAPSLHASLRDGGVVVSPFPSARSLDAAEWAVHAPIARGDGDASFKYTPDYRLVSLRGETFKLSTNQARVVQLLHEHHLGGAPGLNQSYILEHLDIRSKALYQVFRGSAAWDRVVVSDGRGFFRLGL